MALHDQTTALRVAFHTLGCRMNQYDTEGIKAAMRLDRPIEVVDWSQEADLYLLNSCTVTHKADQECRRLARQVKRRHPLAKVVVVGCYAQTQPADLQGVPEIDGVVGNTAKEQIKRWLDDVMTDQPTVLVEEFTKHPAMDSILIDEFVGRSRAFVKIQDGCDLRCAYCLIWQARGPGRSHPLPTVIEQVRKLHEGAGYNELILTGVHLGSYGRDLRGRPERLIDVVNTVVETFPNLRVRLSSIHPDEVSDELLEILATRPQLRPHLHISLQSGSDKILKSMRRPYTRQQAIDAVQKTAAVADKVGIGADVIVGFPGETDEDFHDSMSMVEDLDFTYLHVFRYSARPGTPAAAMTPVPPEIVGQRSQLLRDLAERKKKDFHDSLLGTVREAVIEISFASGPTRCHATTDNYANVTVVSSLPPSSLVEVRPTHWQDGRLHADVVRVLREARPDVRQA